MSTQTIIETPRIILRQFALEDAAASFEFNSNLEVQKYTGDRVIASVEEARDVIVNVSFKDYEQYGYGRWAVVHKADNKVIGFAGLKYLPEFEETDIGFRILPAYWRKGLTTEMCQPIIDYGWNELNLKRIIGIADPKNIGSCKVLEKIGLRFFKVDAYDGDGGMYNWYEIIRGEK